MSNQAFFLISGSATVVETSQNVKLDVWCIVLCSVNTVRKLIPKTVVSMRCCWPQKFTFAVKNLDSPRGRVEHLESRFWRRYDVRSQFCTQKSKNDRFVRKLRISTTLLFFDVVPRHIELSSSLRVCKQRRDWATQWCKYEIERSYRSSNTRVRKSIRPKIGRLL